MIVAYPPAPGRRAGPTTAFDELGDGGIRAKFPRQQCVRVGIRKPCRGNSVFWISYVYMANSHV